MLFRLLTSSTYGYTVYICSKSVSTSMIKIFNFYSLLMMTLNWPPALPREPDLTEMFQDFCQIWNFKIFSKMLFETFNLTNFAMTTLWLGIETKPREDWPATWPWSASPWSPPAPSRGSSPSPAAHSCSSGPWILTNKNILYVRGMNRSRFLQMTVFRTRGEYRVGN